MATTIGTEYDHIDITNGASTVRHPFKDASARENLVKVQDTQPQSSDNVVWIKETPESEVQVPTYAEFEEVAGDVSDLNSAITQLNDNNVITESAGPAPIVSIKDGADRMPLRSLSVAVEPVQDLHGYDSPWPAGGGKNKFPITLESQSKNGTTFTVANDGAITISNTPSELTRVSLNNLSITPNEAMRFSSMGIVTGLRIFCLKTVSGATSYPTISPETTLNSGGTYSSFVLEVSTSFTGTATVKMQLETGSATTDWTPYSNICPIYGWTGAKVTRTGKNLLKLDESEMISAGWNRAFPISIKEGTYIISCQNDFGASTTFGAQVVLADDSNTVIKELTAGYDFGQNNFRVGRAVTITAEEASRIKRIVFQLRAGNASYIDIARGNLQLELGSTATVYEPYQGRTYDVTFPSEAGTVYGGTLDATSGKLVVDRAMLTKNTADMANNENFPGWRNSGIKAIIGSDINATLQGLLNVGTTFSANTTAGNDILYLSLAVYHITESEWKEMNLDVQVCARLANPITYQLTPQEIKTILGENNVWADTGDVSVEYPADTKLYIDNKLAEIQALVLENNG